MYHSCLGIYIAAGHTATVQHACDHANSRKAEQQRERARSAVFTSSTRRLVALFRDDGDSTTQWLYRYTQAQYECCNF